MYHFEKQEDGAYYMNLNIPQLMNNEHMPVYTHFVICRFCINIRPHI